MEAKGEVGRGENGKGFGEDVGDGFVAEEVWVELVSVRWVKERMSAGSCR